MGDLYSSYNVYSKTTNIDTEEEIPPTYSYGSDPAISEIIKLIQTRGTDCITINIATLIRNGYDKNKTLDENLGSVVDTIHNLITNISGVFNTVDTVAPYLYFYLFNYDGMIPVPEYQRAFTSDAKKALLSVNDRFVDYYIASYKTETHIQQFNQLTVVFEVNYNNDPGREISYRRIQKSIAAMRNRHVVALHTHMPIDAHILRLYESVIVRSYRGDSYDYKTYGKVIFDIDIPFLPSVHVLLGDKELLIGLIKRNKKKEFLQLVTDESWYLWSNNKIHETINNMYVLPYTL